MAAKPCISVGGDSSRTPSSLRLSCFLDRSFNSGMTSVASILASGILLLIPKSFRMDQSVAFSRVDTSIRLGLMMQKCKYSRLLLMGLISRPSHCVPVCLRVNAPQKTNQLYLEIR